MRFVVDSDPQYTVNRISISAKGTGEVIVLINGSEALRFCTDGVLHGNSGPFKEAGIKMSKYLATAVGTD